MVGHVTGTGDRLGSPGWALAGPGAELAAPECGRGIFRELGLDAVRGAGLEGREAEAGEPGAERQGEEAGMSG